MLNQKEVMPKHFFLIVNFQSTLRKIRSNLFKEFTENANKAIELIENTLAKNPKDVGAKLNLGLIYVSKGAFL